LIRDKLTNHQTTKAESADPHDHDLATRASSQQSIVLQPLKKRAKNKLGAGSAFLKKIMGAPVSNSEFVFFALSISPRIEFVKEAHKENNII